MQQFVIFVASMHAVCIAFGLNFLGSGEIPPQLTRQQLSVRIAGRVAVLGWALWVLAQGG